MVDGRADDLIDWGRGAGEPDDEPWRTRNVDNATFRGLELEAAGHEFRTDTDTEVVAHLIEDMSDLDLAEAARRSGLQGKAIRYYREALDRDPNNLAAISGEGEALLEKGAIEKARRNLAQLESMCGDDCEETRQLAAALQRGLQATVLTAEAVTPDPVVTQN